MTRIMISSSEEDEDDEEEDDDYSSIDSVSTLKLSITIGLRNIIMIIR